MNMEKLSRRSLLTAAFVAASGAAVLPALLTVDSAHAESVPLATGESLQKSEMLMNPESAGLADALNAYQVAENTLRLMNSIIDTKWQEDSTRQALVSTLLNDSASLVESLKGYSAGRYDVESGEGILTILKNEANYSLSFKSFDTKKSFDYSLSLNIDPESNMVTVQVGTGIPAMPPVQDVMPMPPQDLPPETNIQMLKDQGASDDMFMPPQPKGSEQLIPDAQTFMPQSFNQVGLLPLEIKVATIVSDYDKITHAANTLGTAQQYANPGYTNPALDFFSQILEPKSSSSQK